MISGTLTPKKAKKVFYVYEMTSEGHLVQRYGSNVAGAPFQTLEAAKEFLGEKMTSGNFTFRD